MKGNFLVMIVLLCLGCDPIDNRLTVINNTNHYIVVSDRLYMPDAKVYLNNKIEVDNFEFYENQIAPNDTLKMITKGSWNNSFINYNKMVILVFNKDSIIYKKSKKPEENYDIEQIIYISKDDLIKNNWKVNVNL